MSIGNRIVELRTKAGMNRIQLAEKLDIPMTTLRNYEQDKREPGHKFIIEVADLFGVTTDYILEHEKSPEPEGSEDDERKIDEMEEELRGFLAKYGMITDGGLSDDDFDFLSHVISLIQAYFKK